MDSINSVDPGGKRSLPEDSPPSINQNNDLLSNRHADTPMPRKRFKNNEILSSLSSMKKPFKISTEERPRLDSIDLQIPVPVKRKRPRENSDEEEETPNKKRKKTVSTNSIAIQTVPDHDSIISFDGDLFAAPLETSSTSKAQYVHPLRKSSILVPVIPSQIKSPLRCFTMEEHERDNKRKEARVRRYLEAIRNAVSGPQPKFYEPPVATTVSSTSVFTLPTSTPAVQALPVTSTSSEVVTSTSVTKAEESIKPPSFAFGATSSVVATTAPVTSSPFLFAPAISSSTVVAATTTTTASTGSITTPLVQPPVTSSSPFNFSFKPAEPAKPAVPFQFGKPEQTFSDSPSASPVPGRKIVQGVRRLASKADTSTNSAISTSGFAPFSFAPPVTTQAPSHSSTNSQAPVFNLSNPNPPIFGSGTSQTSAFGSNPAPAFNFSQPTAPALNSSSSQPFAFGSSNPQPPPPSFGGTNQTTFNPQVPQSFDFGGANAPYPNFSAPNNLFTPGTGSVAKRTRKTRGGRR